MANMSGNIHHSSSIARIGFFVFLGIILLTSSPFPTGASEENEPLPGEDVLLDIESEIETEEFQENVKKQFEEMFLEPEEYSVAGAKHPQKIREAPASITVLTQEDIQAYSVLTLEELFRIVPGMDVIYISPAHKQVGIRGFFPIAAHTVLVLVDGREVNVNFMGGVFWNLLPIGIDDVERIEVIRGPGSALYGANAYSGVINIITKNPEDERRADAFSEAVFYNTDLGAYSVKAKGSYVWRHLGVKASVDYGEQYSLSHPDELAAKLVRAYVRTGYDVSGTSRINIDAGFITDDFRYYAYMGELPVHDANLAHVHVFGNWEKLKYKLNWYRYDFKLAFDSPLFSRDMILTIFADYPYPMETKTHNLEAGLEYSLYLGPTDRLTVGTGYILNTFSSLDLAEENNQENRIGIYLQNEWRPLTNLNVVLGIRGDYNSQTEADLSPRASVVYSLHRDHTLRGSFARAFRKPSFFEYGMDLAPFHDILGERIISNPDLGNEHTNSFEIGYNARLLRRLQLSTVLYYYQYRDVMVFAKELVYRIQEDYADCFGGEFHLDFIIDRFLKGFVNYALLEPIDRSDGDPHILHLIDRYSEHKINAGLSWRPLPGLSAGLLLNYLSSRKDSVIDQTTSFPTHEDLEQKLNAQILVGLRLSYTLLDDRAELGIKAWNLLNEDSRQFPGDDWVFDLDGDGEPEQTNYAGESLKRIITGFFRLSW